MKNGLKLLSNINADSSVALMTSHAVISSVGGGAMSEETTVKMIMLLFLLLFLTLKCTLTF